MSGVDSGVLSQRCQAALQPCPGAPLNCTNADIRSPGASLLGTDPGPRPGSSPVGKLQATSYNARHGNT